MLNIRKSLVAGSLGAILAITSAVSASAETTRLQTEGNYAIALDHYHPGTLGTPEWIGVRGDTWAGWLHTNEDGEINIFMHDGAKRYVACAIDDGPVAAGRPPVRLEPAAWVVVRIADDGVARITC
jgi:hypothetical protein